MSLPNNIVRSVYGMADPRTQVRMRAAAPAVVRELATPAMPAKLLVDRVRRAHGRVMAMYRAGAHTEQVIDYAIALKRMREALPGLAGRDAAAVARALRDLVPQRYSYTRKDTRKAPRGDAAYVLAYLSAAERDVAAHQQKVSNASVSRASAAWRAERKAAAAAQVRVGGAGAAARKRAQQQRRAGRREVARAAAARLLDSSTLVPGRGAPFEVMKGAGRRPVAEVAASAAQHPAVALFR